MNTVEVMRMLIAAAVAIAVLLLLARAILKRRVVRDELDWRPLEMRNAELAYAERDFFVSSPDRIVARVDRVYRRPDDVHVVTELKRRDRVRVFESDRIELSVQRLALAKNGLRVSDTGYVVVEGANVQRRALAVQLLPEPAIATLAQRFRLLVAGLVQPTRANRPPVCRKCAFRQECRPDALRGGGPGSPHASQGRRS